MTIDFEELAKEARVNVFGVEEGPCTGFKSVEGWAENHKGLFTNELIKSTTFQTLMQDPFITMAMSVSPSTLVMIQLLFGWWWEMGRLYGRAEVVRETMGE
jgi:hypothetical protein